MKTQLFINPPVADLLRSLAFFKALGYAHNSQFSDDTAACIVISEEILVMVLTHAKFLEFTPKEICDSSGSTEVLLCLSCAKVDEMVAKAVTAGGSTYAEPKDYGLMYGHSFADPDGHQWELIPMSATP